MSSERRRHARIPLAAQVAVTHIDQVHELDALDVSEGGLFLEGDSSELPEFVVGAELNIRIFDPSELPTEDGEDDEDILAMGRIVRVEPMGSSLRAAGFAIEFVDVGEEDQARLNRLLARVGAARGQA